ncbi:crossover junction endodeoxyribonuclease RuvC [Brachybacterium tyrofermentans]|uniref:crossover junction endodeoxyribonuclease RuvC n=1 Tax=Brachybacterium tyrofermentans TaxID=47848 RepID=UPI003FD57D5A
MIVAGIDPSLTSTGVAVIRSPERVETATVTSKSPAPGTETVRTRFERMEKITAGILELIDDADVVGIESPAYGMRNAGKVHDRSGLWWWIVGQLEARGVPIVEVSPPSRMMYATGKGNAGKDLVLVTAAATYKQAEITGNDIADAVVIAAMVSRLAGHPIELREPSQAKLRALAKVHLPEPSDELVSLTHPR